MDKKIKRQELERIISNCGYLDFRQKLIGKDFVRSILLKEISELENGRLFVGERDGDYGIAMITNLDFDTVQYGLKSGELSVFVAEGGASERKKTYDFLLDMVDLHCQAENYEFVGCRTMCEDLPSITSLEEHGFNQFDINVILSCDDFSHFTSSTVRLANYEDATKASELAKVSFNDSRFYHDPSLDKEKVSEMYQFWVLNKYGRDSSNLLVVGDPVSGFILSSIKEYSKNGKVVKYAEIELAAIEEGDRRKGLGSELIAYLKEFYDGEVEFIKVGTHVTNPGSIDYYHQNGFTIKTFAPCFHKHYTKK